MQDRVTCTIAQLLFRTAPELPFLDLIDDIQTLVRGCPGQGHDLTWGDGDQVMLDIQGSRIAVSYQTGLGGDHAACLSIGVGFGPGLGTAGLALRQSTVGRLLVDRIQLKIKADGIIWQYAARDLTPLLLAQLQAELPTIATDQLALELHRSADMAPTRAALVAASAPAPLPEPANDQLPALRAQREELRRVRAALYERAPRPSTALRLAAHAMNATLIVIALPIGAAMMTHGVLRGENLNASARLMAIVGIALGAKDIVFSQGLPWG